MEETYLETPTIWGLNISCELFWEGRRDANYTTQNTWIHDNKYTSGKNKVSLTITSNIPRNGRGMVIWTKYDMVHGHTGVPGLRD